jgi:hypothetical protein
LVDLAVLSEELFEACKNLLAKFGSEDNLPYLFKQLRSKAKKSEGHHSRLAIKREYGGKDRVFAMVDYWSQIILHPLHIGLNKILRRNPHDCTFNQSLGVEDIKRWTREGQAISVDLTSASDRFPMVLQKKIMEKITGDEEFVADWATLMVDRDFKYRKKSYRWKVGQPLGAHSSWPSFALAHHTVMRAAYKKVNQKMEYYLLGDDMVARNSKAIDQYKKYLTLLGVEFSTTKGLEGNSAEFAKRIFNRGFEVSPIPMRFINSTLKDKYLIGELVTQIVEKSSSEGTDLRKPDFVKDFCQLVHWSIDKADIITACPIPQMRKDAIGYIDCPPKKGKAVYQWGSLTVSHETLITAYNKVLCKHFVREMSLMQWKGQGVASYLNKLELPGASPVTRRMHPVFYANQNFRDELSEAWREIELLATSRSFGVITRVKMTNLTDLTKGSKRRAHHNGKLLTLIYDEVLANTSEEEALPG